MQFAFAVMRVHVSQEKNRVADSAACCLAQPSKLRPSSQGYSFFFNKRVINLPSKDPRTVAIKGTIIRSAIPCCTSKLSL